MSTGLLFLRRAASTHFQFIAAFALCLVSNNPTRGADNPPRPIADVTWNAALGLFWIDPSLAAAKELDAEKAVIVGAVTRGGVADKAGIRRGDLILVAEVWDKLDQVGSVKLRRGKEELKLTVKSRTHTLNDFAWSDEGPPPKEKRTLTVKPDGSGTTRTITAALLQARSGDTVVVADGLYEEALLVPPGVTLTAQESAVVRVVAKMPLRLIGADAARVVGLTLRGTDTAALIFRSKNVELRKCDGRSEVGAVVLGGLADDLNVMECRLSGVTKNSVIQIDHSRVKIEQTLISDAERGIILTGESTAELSGNFIESVKYGVVAVGSRVTARKNSLTGADAGTGFYAGEAAVLELTGNFVRHYFQGVQISRGRGVLTKNTLGQNGVGVECPIGEVIATDNFISGNRFFGLRFVADPMSKFDKPTFTIEHNRITGQGGTGIHLEHVSAKVSNNLLEGNSNGIVAENSHVDVRNNTIVLQSRIGLDLKPNVKGTVSANIIAHNSIGIAVDVSSDTSRERNNVYANYLSKSFPLIDGNYVRRDRVTTSRGESLHIMAYPADDLKTASDLNVDPQFVRLGEDYRLSPRSALVVRQGEQAEFIGAFPAATLP